MLNITKYFENWKNENYIGLFESNQKTIVDYISIGSKQIPRYTNQFWTSKQRQTNSIHEISYRACFKAQLPEFFIGLLTSEQQTVYDPFSGRGTTVIQSALMNRYFVANDVNPLSTILAKPRTRPPKISEINSRINEIKFYDDLTTEIDLSIFYHKKTLNEILSLRKYLYERKYNNKEDYIDEWIRMVATNRLTGHSKGFFSVYTLPPNQAVSIKSQIKINQKKNQTPEYRDVKKIILNKSNQLLKNINENLRKQLWKISENSKFYSEDARTTKMIPSNSVDLVVTSPPFLDIVQYEQDNWLRCWFNNIDVNEISKKIEVTGTLDKWKQFIEAVLQELFRVVKEIGFVAFEVGEVKNGRIKLDEVVAEIAHSIGFNVLGIIINRQEFTKTSNIWGIKNNTLGTNTNRIVLFKKDKNG